VLLAFIFSVMHYYKVMFYFLCYHYLLLFFAIT